MSGISRVNTDSAGGTIIGNLAPTVFVEGKPIAVIGAQVAGHGEGEHSNPSMASGSDNIYACSKKVCRQGDSASCGHIATGSNVVFGN